MFVDGRCLCVYHKYIRTRASERASVRARVCVCIARCVRAHSFVRTRVCLCVYLYNAMRFSELLRTLRRPSASILGTPDRRRRLLLQISYTRTTCCTQKAVFSYILLLNLRYRYYYYIPSRNVFVKRVKKIYLIRLYTLYHNIM